MKGGKETGARAVCAAIVDIIEDVDARCAAVDGPVTPTLEEITADELKAIYRLASRGAAGKTPKPKGGRAWTPTRR